MLEAWRCSSRLLLVRMGCEALIAGWWQEDLRLRLLPQQLLLGPVLTKSQRAVTARQIRAGWGTGVQTDLKPSPAAGWPPLPAELLDGGASAGLYIRTTPRCSDFSGQQQAMGFGRIAVLAQWVATAARRLSDSRVYLAHGLSLGRIPVSDGSCRASSQTRSVHQQPGIYLPSLRLLHFLHVQTTLAISVCPCGAVSAAALRNASGSPSCVMCFAARKVPSIEGRHWHYSCRT